MRPEEAKHILEFKQMMVLQTSSNWTPLQAHSVSIGILNIKHMLLNALLDLANISFMLLNWLFASQAIKDMENSELASTQFPKARKRWMVWQNSLKTRAMHTSPEGPIASQFLLHLLWYITATATARADGLFFKTAQLTDPYGTGVCIARSINWQTTS